MKEVKTTYGTFKAGENPGIVALHNKKNKAIGANIYLKFVPNSMVTAAEQLGFVQVAKVIKRGRYDPPDEEVWNNMVKEGTGTGFFVDQMAGYRNPLYATGPEDEALKGGKDDIAGYKDRGPVKNTVPARDDAGLVSAYSDDGLIADRKWYGWGELGSWWPVMSPPKVPTFQDAPHFPRPVKNASMEFETTVLVTSGPQRNTYLGSVKWGFKLGSKGTIDLQEPELVSEGTPSENFMAAAKRWNETSAQVSEEVTKPHIKLPGTK